MAIVCGDAADIHRPLGIALATEEVNTRSCNADIAGEKGEVCTGADDVAGNGTA